ncbi:hypothetical protein WG66_014922 [Moniliophthora roreri]|nr:hypothetical protein WG66_014922 [Moniliophthora roreri]
MRSIEQESRRPKSWRVVVSSLVLKHLVLIDIMIQLLLKIGVANRAKDAGQIHLLRTNNFVESGSADDLGKKMNEHVKLIITLAATTVIPNHHELHRNSIYHLPLVYEHKIYHKAYCHLCVLQVVPMTL